MVLVAEPTAGPRYHGDYRSYRSITCGWPPRATIRVPRPSSPLIDDDMSGHLGHLDMSEYTYRWAIARSRLELDPARYLGEPRDLPAAVSREPGDWCDVVISDGEGEMRWTLVVESVGTNGRPLVDAPGSGRRAGRVAEREGTGLTATADPVPLGGGEGGEPG
jgi:hypothetical protein